MFKITDDYEITAGDKIIDLWEHTQKFSANGINYYARMVDGEIHAIAYTITATIIKKFADTIEFIDFLIENNASYVKQVK